ncbi:hypothetical protein [Halobacillus mangrovi]|uniref:Uncharacterized protein n=1 Tax=Halobacillus mangrovi TaxID=402384 RepID=A0A1W5ZWB7_9BACI|nr:hypothetical protein [Halobacillus mangrovi]ARI77541.1 hypothetical protein HM131_12105 [Halobacillus mangrovi]
MDNFRLALLLPALFVFVFVNHPNFIDRTNEQATSFTFYSSDIVMSDHKAPYLHLFVTKEKDGPSLSLTALFLLLLLKEKYNRKPPIRLNVYLASQGFMIQRKFHSNYL